MHVGERFKEGNNKGKGKLGMEDTCNVVPLDHFRDDRVHEMGCGGIARSFNNAHKIIALI